MYTFDRIEDKGIIFNGDCLEIMPLLIEQGIQVDAIITDVPYGTTSCSWDSVIPFDKMWNNLNQLIKDNSAIVLFGSEPFSSQLRCSNLKMYKYDWIWEKNKLGNFLNCKNSPLKKYEVISIFSNGNIANGSKNMMRYYPQGLIPCNKKVQSVNRDDSRTISSRPSRGKPYIQKQTNYPTNILKFNCEAKAVHPTQKPIELMEYLVKTYTQEDDVILDFTMGSGSTCIACRNTNRKFIGIELTEKYYNVAKNRITKVYASD